MEGNREALLFPSILSYSKIHVYIILQEKLQEEEEENSMHEIADDKCPCPSRQNNAAGDLTLVQAEWAKYCWRGN